MQCGSGPLEQAWPLWAAHVYRIRPTADYGFPQSIVGSPGWPWRRGSDQAGSAMQTPCEPVEIEAVYVPRHRAADEVVRLQSVQKTYGSQRNVVAALTGVTIAFERATFTAVMGPSGSGKSTLPHCAAGLDRPNVRVRRARRPGATIRCSRVTRIGSPLAMTTRSLPAADTR